MNQLSVATDYQSTPGFDYQVDWMYAELSKFDFTAGTSGYQRAYGTSDLFASDTSSVDRRRVYNLLLADVKNHLLPARVLLAYVLFEPNIKLARNATHDYVRYRGCYIPGEFQAVADIVQLVRQGQVENRGAVLAGLVSLKDRRVNAIVRMLRRELSPSDIRDFGRAQEGELCRASVEFCMDWLSELVAAREQESINVICSVLVLMVFHEEQGLVKDYRDGQRVGFSQLPGYRSEKFEAYFERLEPVLERLRDASVQQSTINAVIESWRDHCVSSRRLRMSKRL